MKKLFKFIAILLLISMSSSCLVFKINKDSPALVDFGTPIIGHYRNEDYPKAILYTILLGLGMLGTILFSPSQDGGNKALIGIERKISDPIYYSFLGCTATVPIASSIDSAVTYQIVNQKLLKLNDLTWDARSKKTKYDIIEEFRKKEADIQKEQAEKELLESLAKEIEYYKQKLLNATITEEELLLIEKSEQLKEALKHELGYYYIIREKINIQN